MTKKPDDCAYLAAWSGARYRQPSPGGCKGCPTSCRVGAVQPGGVVEWLMAPVLKTGESKDSVGSNPTPSVFIGSEGIRGNPETVAVQLIHAIGSSGRIRWTPIAAAADAGIASRVRASVPPLFVMPGDKAIKALRPDPDHPGTKHHDRDGPYLGMARSGSKTWRKDYSWQGARRTFTIGA